ncbi:hypothetical protein J2T18_003567 [Paenibacillus polymyxa]|nr:hypothetical protein [Paenibacillus polymyxa]
MGDGKEPCVFFGPGGSAFDASSKAAAVPVIENGVVAGIHFGTAQDGQTVYPDAVTAGTPQTILAVIDDRAENRRQLIEASARSSSRLIAKGLDDIMDIASAAKGFCPEVDVAGMAAVVSSFVFEANV